MENSPALIDGLEIVEKRLLEKDRVFTVGDVASITGYRTDEAKQILDRLIAKYDCKLKITAEGDLIYDFGDYPHKRGERTWAEWRRGVRKWCWKVFMVLFKIWIAVTLVVYFLVFLLILVAIIVASIAGNKDGDSSDTGIGDSIGGFFKTLWEIFESAFRWQTHYHTTHYHVDMYGYSYREYDHLESPLNKNKKSFVASVYDFVFGAERVEMHPLANQQEAGAYIRTQKGLIVVPEIIALAGWKGGEAENFLSELVVRYQGEAKISNQSLLYGDFTDFARQQTTQKETPIVWYWDEYEPEHKLTGNAFWRNFWIVFMGSFNLIASLIFIGIQLNPDQVAMNISPKDTAIFVVLGWIPFVFSVLFFGIPILRLLELGHLRRKRKMANIRKRVMRAIYQSDKEVISLQELKNTVNQANNLEKLTEDEVSKIMNEMIIDFYGDIDFDAKGQAVYKFTRLREEMQEIQKLRGGQNTDMGRIVFESN